jgi:uncharacterized membrane protein YeaQ/YmgE (transglycosylase-associated protein family)
MSWMSEEVLSFLMRIVAFLVLIGIGAGVSWFFYHFKNRDLLGGFIGGLVVGVIGALVGAFLLYLPLEWIIDFLQVRLGINTIAGFIGAFVAVYVMNRLNHNKERKKF